MNIQIGDIARHEPSGIEGRCVAFGSLYGLVFNHRQIECRESSKPFREWFKVSELVLVKKAGT